MVNKCPNYLNVKPMKILNLNLKKKNKKRKGGGGGGGVRAKG